MAYEQFKVKELVNRAVEHKWSIPEFQRGFVWKAVQVRDLAESLWLNYPIGSLLIWNSKSGEERLAVDALQHSDWLVDGQQRTTALCVLFGRKPYWWPTSDEWNKLLKRYDIRFDVTATEAPYFWVASETIRRTKLHKFIPLSQLLNIDISKSEGQKELEDLSMTIKAEGLCDGLSEMNVYSNLEKVGKIREKEIVAVTIDHELEDVVEIFSRVNGRGSRVTEADIYLGIVAGRNPKWVRDEFLPYLNSIQETGFDIDPNLLFRSITALGVHTTRFRAIENEFWYPERILPVWKKSQDAWKRLKMRFQDYGISTTEIMPTQAALITMLALVDKFEDNNNFPLSLYWFIQASRFGRYSGSGATALDEDLKDIYETISFEDAINKLLRRFNHEDPIKADDFIKDYLDGRFGRFLLYLMVYHNEAQVDARRQTKTRIDRSLRCSVLKS
ncbi:MAG: hypothetical protein Ta2B_15310 [Termitinemataceae bacterium]|nr:MAG: hypothetical protein Ta2B_15310 [Termitinemataceae bacterium]